jgi:hypothetical protein
MPFLLATVDRTITKTQYGLQTRECFDSLHVVQPISCTNSKGPAEVASALHFVKRPAAIGELLRLDAESVQHGDV